VGAGGRVIDWYKTTSRGTEAVPDPDPPKVEGRHIPCNLLIVSFYTSNICFYVCCFEIHSISFIITYMISEVFII